MPIKSRIKTPHLDQLSKQGAYFRTAYTHCPICVAARTSLLTGKTIEHTGVRSNWGKSEVEIHKHGVDAGDKIPLTCTYDEILVSSGYVAEYTGKWHTTESKGYCYQNDVTANTGNTVWFGKYEDINNQTKHFAKALHPRYNAWLRKHDIQVCRSRKTSGSCLNMGKSCIPDGFSLTHKQGEEALASLRRLASHSDTTPFSLHLSFNAPHVPIFPTAKYYNMYDPGDMLLPANLLNDMANSAYQEQRQSSGQCKQRALANESIL